MLKAAHPAKVIVEQSVPPERSELLFIPEAARIKPMDGVVRAVGSKVTRLHEGDRVLVSWQHGGTEQFTHEGKDYWLLHEHQIIAVLP